MPSVRLSYAALKDLADIDAYTDREWGQTQADRYLNKLQTRLLKLLTNPRLGRECLNIEPGLRRIEEGKHVMFYRQAEDGIVVSRILHQSMLPELHDLNDEL
jgi:toxin ParE1/3/4